MELDSIVHGCAPYFIFVGIEFRMNCGFGSGLVTFHLNLCTRFVLDMQTSWCQNLSELSCLDYGHTFVSYS